MRRRAVVRGRELHRTRALSDETYFAAEAALGRAALVALVSTMLNAFRAPTPDGSRPFADL